MKPQQKPATFKLSTQARKLSPETLERLLKFPKHAQPLFKHFQFTVEYLTRFPASCNDVLRLLITDKY